MKTLPFRLYAQILIFTGLVALGGLILWPLQQALYGGMIGVRDDIINRLENQIGRRIRYSSISPSIFGSFDVRNVRILGEDERSVLSMSRLRIVYSFIDLLRGRSLAIRSVRIDSPHIDLDTARDHDLLNMLETAKTGQGDSLPNFLDILPEKLLVQVRNGKCLVYSSGDLFDLDSLNLSAEISGDMVILDGRWNIGVMMDKLIGKPVIMRLVMRADGSFRSNMEEGEAVLSITSISGDAETAAPFSFGFALKERTVSLWKMHDQLPLDLSLEYGLDEGNFNASFACSDFMLRDYFNFSGGLEGARQFLNIAGSGSANVMRSREGNLGYSVDFAGEALALPGVLQDQAIDASFGIFASGDEKKVRIDKLYFSMPPTGETETEAFFFGSISFSGDLALGPFAPEGIVSLGDFSLTGKDGLNGQISVSTSAYSGEISAFSETLSFGQGDQAVDLTAFAASLYPSGDALDLTVSALRFMNTESYDNVRMGSFSLTGTLDTAARTARAGIILDSFSAGDLAFMAMPFVQDLSIRAPLMAALRSTSVTTEFSFSTDFDHFLFDAPRLVFAGYAAKGFVGLFSVSGSDSHFELNEGRIIWGDDAMRFSGKAEFSNPENIVFSANAGYGDMEYIIEGEILEGKSIGIHGSHGLDVSLTASGGGAYSGYIRTESYPMPFLGYQLGNTGAFGSLGGASANRGLSGPAWAPALLTIDAKMNYETASAWSIELDMLEIAGITSPAGLAQIQLAGNADQNGANFPLLFYRDNIGALSGRASVSWPPGLPGFSGTAALAGGKENYLLDVSGGIGRLNLRLAGTAMRLDRVFGMSNNFVADGNVNLSWETAEVFLAELNLSSFTGKVLDQEFRASARAVLDSGGCSVSNLRLNLAGIEAAVPQFSISGRRGTAEASAELKGILGGKRLEGNLSLAASFSPIRSWLRIEDLLNSVAGKVHFDAFRFGDTGDPQAFDIGFSRSDGGLSVSGGPRDMVRLHMDREGNFFAGLSSPFP
ncbi:MAG: hypothetical protein FWH38_08530, partial [Treponema sp.]|nr:hypothetical protein [Treponema sp.]